MIYSLLFCIIVSFVNFVVRLPKSAKSGWPKLVQISRNSWFNFVPFVSFVVKKVKNTIAKRPHNFVPLCLCNFATLKNKTKPKQSQTKPNFQGSNLNLSEITRIVADFTQHFLCKTKPNSVVGIQIPVEYDISEKVNYTTCPAPTLRLFHKVGAVKTKPIFSKIQFENKGLTTVSLVQHLQGKCCGKVGAQIFKN